MRRTGVNNLGVSSVTNGNHHLQRQQQKDDAKAMSVSQSGTRLQTLRDFGEHCSHVNFHRSMLIISALCLAVGFAVGFSTQANSNQQAADEDYARTFELFTSWQIKVTGAISEATAVAGSVAAFATAFTDLRPANMSAPASERFHELNPKEFMRMCHHLARDAPGVGSMTLCPGGVLSQTWSKHEEVVGFDLYNAGPYKSTYHKMMRDGLPAVTGPNPMKSRPNATSIFIWYPVFVNDTVSPSTFWGCASTLIEIADLLDSIGIYRLLHEEEHYNYVIWYTDATATANATADDVSGVTTHIVTSTDPSQTDVVMREGMSMRLPIGEEGKLSYLAMYPCAGAVSSAIPAEVIVAIVLATVFGTMLIIGVFYLFFLLYFLHRHRRAPSPTRDSAMFLAILTLRGAQPIADRAPLEAVRMFSEFTNKVRAIAAINNCYFICEVGDRSAYVVSRSAVDLMALAQECVANVSVVGNRSAIIAAENAARHRQQQQRDHHDYNGGKLDGSSQQQQMTPNNKSASRRHSRVSYSDNRSRPVSHATTTERPTPKNNNNNNYNNTNTNKTDTNYYNTDDISEMLTESSFMATTLCHPSAACHAVSTTGRYYDIARDVYFYGTASVVGKICAALDQTRSGETVWTEAFNRRAPNVCQAAIAACLTSHIITTDSVTGGGDGGDDNENNNEDIAALAAAAAAAATNQQRTTAAPTTNSNTLQVASWWTDTGDERDNEDPSTAMAALNDAYVKRMTIIIGRGNVGSRHGNGGRNGGGGSGGKGEGGGSSGNDNNKDNSGGGGKMDASSSTNIVRSATLLSISFLRMSEAVSVFDSVRRIVADEKGCVISAHERTIVAAFNLLTPGGHHQMRAADCLSRLRAALPQSVMFVASLHFGKVTAVVADGGGGLVMCTGEAVTTARLLLERAIEAAVEESKLALLSQTEKKKSNSKAYNPQQPTTMTTTTIVHSYNSDSDNNTVAGGGEGGAAFGGGNAIPTTSTFVLTPITNVTTGGGGSSSAVKAGGGGGPVAASIRGLCMLLCMSEVGTSYECEAVGVFNAAAGKKKKSSSSTINGADDTDDFITASGSNKVLYRLVARKSSTTTNNKNGGGGGGGGGGGANNNNNNKRNNNMIMDIGIGGGATGDDEWMYRLQEEEDASPYAVINSLYARLAENGLADARAAYEKVIKDSEEMRLLSNNIDAADGDDGRDKQQHQQQEVFSSTSEMSLRRLKRILYS